MDEPFLEFQVFINSFCVTVMWEKSANQAASPEIKKFPSFKLNFLPIWYICLANFQWPKFPYKNCPSIPTISIPNNNTIGGYKSFGSGELIADVVIIPGPGHAQTLSKMFRPTNIDYRKHKKSKNAISCLMLNPLGLNLVFWADNI